MANPEHVEILKQGVEVWNRWREENTSIKPDLSVADFQKRNLNEVNFSGVNLSYTNLIMANLIKADLQGANLLRTKFNGTDLIEADLTEANIRGVNFKWANLQKAIFQRAKLHVVEFYFTELEGANFNDTVVSYLILVKIDLSKVKGLDSVHHDAPSSIGMDTIYESGGHIPRLFLRGCGVPENFITY